ncbi:MAG TPA: SGNH/GDSL hydrolase family protein [Polyangiaceae bacterium]
MQLRPRNVSLHMLGWVVLSTMSMLACTEDANDASDSSGGTSAGTVATAGNATSGGASQTVVAGRASAGEATAGGGSSSGGANGGRSPDENGGNQIVGGTAGRRDSGPGGTGGLPSSAGNTASGGSTPTSAGAGAMPGGGTAGTSAVLEIMPLGDSITAASCYRPKLWKKLSDAGFEVDFVGTRTGNGCPEPAPAGFDADNEGHGCYLVTHLLRDSGARPSGCTEDPYAGNSSDLARWFDSQAPDVVLMHFGTNDIWNGIAHDQILEAYTVILNQLRARNPTVKVFVAQIIPLRPNAAMPDQYTAAIELLNDAIPGWVSVNTTEASPVRVVDQNTGYDVADFSDGVHPTPAGAERMAQRWFEAIRPLWNP